MAIDFMAIGAHPDDIEIGMGGTIAALVEQGHSVVMVDLTDGEPTPQGSHEIRMQEARASADLLGVKERVTLDIPNREIMDTIENRKKLAAVIRQYQPQVLFIHYGDDAHPDHVEACKLSISARFYAKLTKTDIPFDPHYPPRFYHFFSTHIAVRIEPTFIFDISDHMEAKVEALHAYHSQFIANPQNTEAFERARIRAQFWGQQIKRPFGEPFVCKENLAIHDGTSLLHLT